MKQKKGVVLAGLKIVMRNVLIQANDIWDKYGKKLVVTAGLEGNHSAGSLHYYGYAVDLRTWYFSKVVKAKVARELQEALGSDYDVIVHKTHIHVEYDPKS